MAWLSFIGRLLFVTVFVLSAYQEFAEFGVDSGGSTAKSLEPKFKAFSNHVTMKTGLQITNVEIKHLVLGAIVIKATGSLLFVLGNSLGAYLLLLHQAITTLVLYDFYNYEADHEEFAQLFVKFRQNLALFGALLFFISMKKSIPRRSSKKKASHKAKTV